jgi:hypothetical protein
MYSGQEVHSVGGPCWSIAGEPQGRGFADIFYHDSLVLTSVDEEKKENDRL